MRLGLGLGLVRLGKAIASFVRDGLKLYYPFKDNSPELLLSGATSFDGTDDYISIADSDSLSFGDGSTDSAFSISAWINMNDATDFIIVSKGSYNVDAEYRLYSHGSDLLSLELFDESLGSTYELVSSASAITSYEGKWTHVSCTYTGVGGTSANAGIKLYINGSQIAVNLGSGGNYVAMENLGANVEIGRSGSTYSDGSIANVGIWNRALSASEIESIYWKGQYADLKGTELTNLVSWYNLKDTGFGSDVVTNGDLWTGASGSTKPTGWSGSGGGTPTHTIVDLSSVANFDSTTLRFTATGVRNIYQQNALSGVKYKVEFAYRTDSSSNYIYIGSSVNQIALSNTGLSGDATLVSQEITSNGSGIGIQIITSDSTIEISNINVYPVSALDSQGTNNGTIVGATTLTDAYSASSPFLPRIQDKATPKGAVALASGSTSFDGTDDYISFPFQESGNYTISAWFKLDVVQTSIVVNWGDQATGERRSLLIWNGGSGGYKVYSSTYGSNIAGSTSLSTGVWYHASVTVDVSDGSAKIYLNGSLDGSGTNTINSFTGTIGEIGRQPGGEYFEGSLANVAIYSDVKTQSQIQDIMFSSYSTLTSALKTNLVSWYDLGSTPIEAGSNLSTNGNFDSNTTGWTAVRASLSSVTGGQSGNCLAVTRDSGSDQSAYQSFSVTNGKTYRLKVYIKSGSSGDESFHIQLVSGSDFGRTEGISSGEWVAHTLDYAATATTMSITLRKNSSTAGTMLFDTVSVKEIQATDSQGDNEGSIYGATTNTGYTSSPSGVADPLNYGEVYGGNAVSFDGTNDKVQISNFPTIGQTSSSSGYSISCYFKADSVSAWVSLFSFGDQATSEKRSLMISSGGKLSVSHYNDNVSGSTTLSTGVWYHGVCTVASNGSVIVYLNGSSDGTGSVTLTSYSGTTAYIGSNPIGNGEFFNGMMSGVKIFNTALTQDQVRELYTKPELTLPTGIASSALKLDMPMQEGSGTAILDGSPTFLDVAVNGDFSADAVGSTSVTGWSLDDFTAEVIADGYTGNAVQLTRADSGTQSFYQDLSGITSGNEYKINVKLKAIGGSVAAGIRVTTPTNSNPSSNIVSLPADGSWQDVELSFTAQGTTARIQIQRQESDPGSIVVDDVIINQLNLGQNHGTGNGITWATGQEYGFQHPLVRSNNPMVFDGADDKVTVGTPSALNNIFTGGGTLSAWINPKSDGQNNAGQAFDKGKYAFQVISESSGSVKVQFAVTLSGGAARWETPRSVFLNTWTHILVTYDSDNPTTDPIIYLNGSAVSLTETISPSGTHVSDASSNLTLGNRNDGVTTFDGLLNDLAIWDSALTANEVTALYNSGLPLLPTTDSGNYASADDLVGYWRNDGVTTWLDRSTNSNNGTVAGDPASIIVPEGLNEGRDSQGYYLTDTDSISSGIRFKGAEYIDIGKSESYPFKGGQNLPFSVEAWVKMNDLTALNGVIGNSGECFYIRLLSNGRIEAFLKGSGGGYIKQEVSSVTSAGWHHLCVTYDGSGNRDNINIFWDSTEQSNAPASSGTYTSLNTTANNLQIGTMNGSSYLKGSLDEIRIYDKVLSNAEILKNYNNGKSAH
jgi:hypothetical protein